MIEHVWSVLCKMSAIDPQTKNISLYDVVEVVRVAWRGMTTIVLTPMEIVSLWTRDATNAPERGEARIFLAAPSGSESLYQVEGIDLRQYRRIRVRYKISALQIEGPGVYNFNVEFRRHEHDSWRPTAKIPVEIFTG